LFIDKCKGNGANEVVLETEEVNLGAIRLY